MFTPKQVKHRKWHKGRNRFGGVSRRGADLVFGSFGLQAAEAAWINSRQLEAARRVMTRFIQRRGKVWIRIFPDKPRTKKGAETPMGKGKGGVDHFVAPVRAGRVLFEIDGVEEKTAKEALRLASNKLPVKAKIIKN